MNRIGLKAKLLIGMFLILCVSIALVASQAVMLFQEDKASYVFELNATQAIKIADEIQANVRHLTEKIRILFDAARLPLPAGPERTSALVSMLRQYPEFLLLSVRGGDGTLNNLVHSPALERFGLTIDDLQAIYLKTVPFDQVTADKTFVARVAAASKSPTFTLAVRALPGSDGAPGPVLVAEVPLDRLYAAGGTSKLFEIAIADAGGRPLVSLGRTASSNFAELLPKTARTAGTREYLEGGVAMLGAYAPAGDLGLWAIVQIPKALAFEAARRLITRSLVLAGVVGILALALVFLFSSSITGPLVALTRATEQIGQGQFDVQIPVSAGGEIGALGARFKRMTEELSAREAALKEANTRLIESEKMTALGQLGAGIAHEVKNPMTSIRGYAQMGMRKVPEGTPLFEYFKTIEKETGRSLDILKNLLKFSRQETAEMSLIDVNTVVTDTLKLVTHQLQMKKVEVIPQLCEGALQVLGNANQLEQVLLNLCMNAGDAMERGGTLTVATEMAASAAALVRVSDTGSGIPPETLGRIFDPFFTTKPVGKGTGLGLSVSYGIVKDHKGEIKVESRVGHGTTFNILIPLAPGVSQAAVAAPGGEKRVRVISLR
jgi:two-component system, NtrC family, sensor kinase